MAPAWRFLAQRITGDGQPGAWLDTDLPLSSVTVTDVLSGPPRLTASITPEYRRLKVDGRPLLDEWGTIVYAEADGQIRGTGIYTGGRFNGPAWELDCAGFTAYPAGMGYESSWSQAGVDPLDVVRHLWAHLQSGQSSDLGMAVDSATVTPVRLGTLDEPFELSWWSTHDIGRVIDDLAGSTPFDYIERHGWNQRRDQVEHLLLFGYPRIGARRPEARFVLGENVHARPAAARDGANYASHVRFLGAGEGRAMVRAESMAAEGRLRRMVTVDDKSVQAVEHAFRAAAAERARRVSLLTVSEVTVTDSPAARLGTFGPGDEVRLQGELDWVAVDMWVRIVSVTTAPDTPGVVRVALVGAGQ